MLHAPFIIEFISDILTIVVLVVKPVCQENAAEALYSKRSKKCVKKPHRLVEYADRVYAHTPKIAPSTGETRTPV